MKLSFRIALRIALTVTMTGIGLAQAAGEI